MTALAGVNTDADSAPTRHARLVAWVSEVAQLTTPDQIHWCTGSREEWDRLAAALVAQGSLVPLDPVRRPNSFWARTDPSDVARVEGRTFICSVDPADAGPTNNWMAPEQMKATMRELYRGCMRGRTLYVLPFCMGSLEAEQPLTRNTTKSLSENTKSIRCAGVSRVRSGFARSLASMSYPGLSMASPVVRER